MLGVIKPILASITPNSVRVAYSAMAESGVVSLMCYFFCKNTLGLENLQEKQSVCPHNQSTRVVDEEIPIVLLVPHEQ